MQRSVEAVAAVTGCADAAEEVTVAVTVTANAEAVAERQSWSQSGR